MARRDGNDALKQKQKDKEISEDDQKRGMTELQKITDDYIKKVDTIGSEKEKELLTI